MLMALFSIKGGNIGQAMAQAQARSVNAWAYFQAKSTKQTLAESMLDQLLLDRERATGLPPDAIAVLNKKIDVYRGRVERYESEKATDGDSWRHTRITLKPANLAFDPIVLSGAGDQQLVVVGQFVALVIVINLQG